MLSPLSIITAVVNPNTWIRLGRELLRASPILTPIYIVLLMGLQAIPVRNPNANLERLAMLQQQLAFFATIDGYLIVRLGKDYLRRR